MNSMARDFRSHLEHLETRGKLCRVKKEVDIRFDIAAGIRKASDTDGPALLFENIRGYPGWRVAGGVFGTKKLVALALGTEPEEEKLVRRYLEFDQKRIKPKLVSTGPVKDIVIKGADVDLNKLPIPTYSELDCGPYLTAGIEIAKDPDTATQNASIHRRLLLAKNRTSLLAPIPHHLGLMIQAAEEKGKSLAVATVLGAPPELSIASQINAPAGVDEMEIAGGLRGSPLEVVKCETIDLEVPTDAEVVIEGVTIPGERVADGPFAEVVGTYGVSWNPESLAFQTPVIKITAITMRKDPIFQAMLTGMPMTENHWIKKWAVAAAIHRELASVVPDPDDIRAVNVTPGGAATHHAVVAIHKRSEGTARDIIYTLLRSRLFLWHVKVVDEDISVYDPFAVEWAVVSRAQIPKDLIVLTPDSNMPSIPIYTNRWGIDATKPLTHKDYYTVRIPGVGKVDYI